VRLVVDGEISVPSWWSSNNLINMKTNQEGLKSSSFFWDFVLIEEYSVFMPTISCRFKGKFYIALQ